MNAKSPKTTDNESYKYIHEWTAHELWVESLIQKFKLEPIDFEDEE